jgi:hypothetical protein
VDGRRVKRVLVTKVVAPAQDPAGLCAAETKPSNVAS